MNVGAAQLVAAPISVCLAAFLRVMSTSGADKK